MTHYMYQPTGSGQSFPSPMEFGQTESKDDHIEWLLNDLEKCSDESHSDGLLIKLALAYDRRYATTWKMVDLEECISYYRRTVAHHSEDHEDYVLCMNNFATAVHTRFQQLGRMEDLEEAIKYHHQALDFCPLGHPNHSTSLANLAKSIHTRFEQLGRMEDLEDALGYFFKALNLCPPGDSNHSMTLNNLGSAVLTRFKQLGRIEDLEKAILYHYQALDLCPPGHSNYSMILNNLGCAVYTRFKQLGRIEDLENAMKYHHQALDWCPLGHFNHSSCLHNFANTLHTSFEQLGRMEYLDEAIKYHHQALDICPPGHLSHSRSLINLASAVHTRFQQLGRMEDLEEAIKYYHQALDLCPPGHPNHSTSLTNLANAVHTRFWQLGRMEDLEDAIKYYHQALDLCPPGHFNHSMTLHNLANTIHTRFQQLGRMEDLDEAIEYCHQALDLCPPGHFGHSSSLINLANAVHTRFWKLGRIEDLEEAIEYHYQALQLHRPGHPNHSSSLASLADAIHTRFEQLGRIADLEGAIKYYYQALYLCPPGHPNHSTSLNNLANAVHSRFHQLGRMEDLEDAIKYHHQALQLYPANHPSYPSSLTNLANTVHARFEQLGRMEDLEEAIEYHHQALHLCPPGHSSHSSSLINLANVVHTRFWQLGRMEDLEKAIKHYYQALDLCPPGNPNHSISLTNLANAVHTRFEQLGRMEDLEEAIRYHHQALYLCPSGHPSHSISLISLANAAQTRFKLLNNPVDLCEAAEALKLAQECVDQNSPVLAHIKNYAAHQHVLFHIHNNCNHCSCIINAIDLLKETGNHSSGSIKIKLEAARQWIDISEQYDHKSVIEPFSRMLLTIQQHLSLLPSAESQHGFISNAHKDVKSGAVNAAAWAIKQEKLEQAVEFLEQGRAILWSKMQGYHHPIESLRLQDPKLAQELFLVNQQLEHTNFSQNMHFESLQLQRTLSDKRCKLLARIREIDGFSDFLEPIKFNSLRKVAADGPVILVNISQVQSDAVIILPGGHPALVMLPNASLKVIKDCVTNLYSAISDPGSRSSGSIAPILRTLWENVVCPIVDELQTVGIPLGSRIWWCPTSYLCALPIHAAGPYRKGQKNLPDMYISSYTPTLNSLIRARSDLQNSVSEPKLLLVSQPGDTLPHVAQESGIVQKYVKQCSPLVGEQATNQAVLEQLTSHSWAHFACHGHIHSQPFKSWFELHNKEHLEVLGLAKTRLPNAEFAFLSACHTAAVDVHGTPDEFINLAGAMQFCGFRGVVGTLWAMVDDDGPSIAEKFYGHMFRDPENVDFRDAAEAINLTTKAMRKAGVPLERWINFVHIGA